MKSEWEQDFWALLALISSQVFNLWIRPIWRLSNLVEDWGYCPRYIWQPAMNEERVICELPAEIRSHFCEKFESEASSLFPIWRRKLQCCAEMTRNKLQRGKLILRKAQWQNCDKKLEMRVSYTRSFMAEFVFEINFLFCFNRASKDFI